MFCFDNSTGLCNTVFVVWVGPAAQLTKEDSIMSNAKAINVLITRNKDGETVENVAAAPVVRAEELRATGNALDNLTRNVMAGRVGAPIRKAADNGKLADVLPGDQLKNQRSALAFLLGLEPEAIRAAWAGYCEGRERVTPPTLQRLHKECKPSKPRESFNYAQAAKDAAQAMVDGNDATVSQILHDVAAELGILKDEEPAH